jgi:hypothetical protein
MAQSVNVYSFQTYSVKAYVYQTRSVKVFAFVALPYLPITQVSSHAVTDSMRLPAYQMKIGTALVFRTMSVKA